MVDLTGLESAFVGFRQDSEEDGSDGPEDDDLSDSALAEIRSILRRLDQRDRASLLATARGMSA